MTNDSRPTTVSPGILLWAGSVALFTILALADAVDYYAGWRLEGHPGPFWRALLAAFPGWELWVALGPLIFFVARRIRLTWPPAPLPLLLHLGLSILFGAAHAAIHSAARWLFGVQLSDYAPLQLYTMVLLDWLPISMLVYWAILGTFHGLEYYQRYRETQLEAAELAQRLTEARLEALTAQLHPHFLFNALNAAVALVRTGDGPAAVGVLTQLGDILRHLLSGTAAEIPLRDELAFLERYLAIEQVRFGHRLTVDIAVPAELGDALVPNLVLQPLVENALRHGLAEQEKPGRIAIEANASGGLLRLLVRDDGAGLPVGWKLERSDGVGLNNTRARLVHLYGKEASLELFSEPTGGTAAVVSLPLRRGR